MEYWFLCIYYGYKHRELRGNEYCLVSVRCGLTPKHWYAGTNRKGPCCYSVKRQRHDYILYNWKNGKHVDSMQQCGLETIYVHMWRMGKPIFIVQA